MPSNFYQHSDQRLSRIMNIAESGDIRQGGNILWHIHQIQVNGAGRILGKPERDRGRFLV